MSSAVLGPGFGMHNVAVAVLHEGRGIGAVEMVR